MLAGVVEVADGAAVSHYDAGKTPFVAEDILKETVAAAAGLSLITLVCAHNFLHVGILHNRAEGREVSLPEVAHRNFGVEAVAVSLGATVHCVVLCAGVDLEVFLVVTLHSFHSLDAHHSVEVGVLAGSLLSAAPAGIAEDVDVGTPE